MAATVSGIQCIKCFFMPCKVFHIPCKLAPRLVPPFLQGWGLVPSGTAPRCRENLQNLACPLFQMPAPSVDKGADQVSPGDKQLSLGSRSSFTQWQQWHQVCGTAFLTGAGDQLFMRSCGLQGFFPVLPSMRQELCRRWGWCWCLEHVERS